MEIETLRGSVRRTVSSTKKTQVRFRKLIQSVSQNRAVLSCQTALDPVNEDTYSTTLMGLFDRLFGRTSKPIATGTQVSSSGSAVNTTPAKRRKYTERELPPAGSVFVVPLADGRFGVVRVIRTKTSSGHAFALVAASAWIGTAADRPADSEIRRTLVLNHHKWAEKPYSHWVNSPPPASFVSVGRISGPRGDAEIADSSYGAWDAFPLQILMQWRWDHDREAVLREDAEKAARQAEERRLQEERRAEYLRTVTLDSLADKEWFASWNPDLDGGKIPQARQIVAKLVADLASAGKLTKSSARRLLKTAVTEFNVFDQTDRFIETTHREDICEAMEVVICAARFPDLASEVDEWRDW